LTEWFGGKGLAALKATELLARQGVVERTLQRHALMS
jgi:hypothetical protein